MTLHNLEDLLKAVLKAKTSFKIAYHIHNDGTSPTERNRTERQVSPTSQDSVEPIVTPCFKLNPTFLPRRVHEEER